LSGQPGRGAAAIAARSGDRHCLERTGSRTPDHLVKSAVDRVANGVDVALRQSIEATPR
jgi:hypothetical protein